MAARDQRRPVVNAIMTEFGLEEHQAKYHYSKIAKKGLVPTRKMGHAPRIAIMFLNSPREERIELCQQCKHLWPCPNEQVRRKTEAKIESMQAREQAREQAQQAQQVQEVQEVQEAPETAE